MEDFLETKLILLARNVQKGHPGQGVNVILTVRLSDLQSESEKNPWWLVKVPNRVHRFLSRSKSPPCGAKSPIKEIWVVIRSSSGLDVPPIVAT